MKSAVILFVFMNILRLVAAEKERKSRPNPEFQKLEKEATSNTKSKGEAPIRVDKDELKGKLNTMEYHVTQERGTERPFSGKYLRMKEDGVYTCIVCDNPLFRSDQKYDSGCGWPSFHDVMAHGKVTLTKDTSHGMVRTEVRCSHCGAHLGHVFDDGPAPLFQRYCINSAALRFVPEKITDSDSDEDTTKDDSDSILMKNEL